MAVGGVKKGGGGSYPACSSCLVCVLLLLVSVFGLRGRYVSAHPVYLQCTISSLVCAQAACALLLPSTTSQRYSAHRLVRIALAYLLSIPALHVVVVLFGAPILAGVAETLHLAALLASLVVLPYALFNKLDTNSALRLWILFSPVDAGEKQVLITSLSTLAGAWVGAWPIPLDWDRPWQQWPVTCTTGAVLGYCAAAVFNVLNVLYHSLSSCHSSKKKPVSQKQKNV